jgi:hypothetical protein
MDESKLIDIIIEVREDIASIKTDLLQHMKRTEINEKAIELHKRYLYMAHGALGLIGLLATFSKFWH